MPAYERKTLGTSLASPSFHAHFDTVIICIFNDGNNASSDLKNNLNKSMNDSPYTSDSSLSSYGPVLTIGDSMTNNIIPEKLCSKSVKNLLYPGKNAEEISFQVDQIQMHSSLSSFNL